MSWLPFTRRQTTGFLAALALPAALTVAGCDGYDDDADYTDPAQQYERTAPPSERDEELAEEIARADEARAKAAEERDEAARERDDDDRLTEAQVLGIARALNQGEVDHAAAAQGRLVDAEASSLCSMILQDHQAAVAKIDQVAQAAGIVPAPSEKAQDLTKEVQDEIADLRDDEGEELAEEFIEDQKGMHERALKTFDDDLLPASTNPRIVQLLTELRASVAAHLEHIKQLEAAD